MIRMNRTVFVTLVLLLLETSVVPWLVPGNWSDRLLPHLTFIMTLYVASFGGRHPGFLFGLGFGLLGDLLFYGHLIGPYGFGMGLIGYLAGLVLEQRSFTLAFFLGVAALAGGLLDTIVFFIYKLFSLTRVSYGYAFYWQIIPTLLLELIIILALYVPVRRFLTRPLLSSGEEGA
ncbi:rod shape-determining protein MreD [Cohnella faecalis]|uniref:rod shape-determining protein MreD n=1 Tax=Cohnella faecalis TaxID=2315694 RepID=UPI00360BF90C